MAATFVFLYQTIDIPDPNQDFLDEQSTILYDEASPSSAPSPSRSATRSR